MCKFLSFVTTKDGAFHYCPERRTKGTGNLDSHSFIAERYGVKSSDNPIFYEYAPIGDTLVIDGSPSGREDCFDEIKAWARALPYSAIVPELVIKPIINPLLIERGAVTDAEIELLKNGASVGDSVGASVRDSVRDSVGASVRDSVGASVGDSVGDSVWDSVGDSVWDSVGASVWDSVGASVGAYIGSFFRIDALQKFSSCVELWESGLVPSFDGKTWRLHAGKDAAIVWEGVL